MTSDEGAITFSEQLKNKIDVGRLQLFSTWVGAALAEALEKCTPLKMLDNMFGVESGIALSKVLIRIWNLNSILI